MIRLAAFLASFVPFWKSSPPAHVREFNTLVRLRIPGKISSNGRKETPIYYEVKGKEFLSLLRQKLVKEAQEVLGAKTRTETVRELADVLEVLKTIMRLEKITPEEIEIVRIKRSELSGPLESNGGGVYIVQVDKLG